MWVLPPPRLVSTRMTGAAAGRSCCEPWQGRMPAGGRVGLGRVGPQLRRIRDRCDGCRGGVGGWRWPRLARAGGVSLGLGAIPIPNARGRPKRPFPATGGGRGRRRSRPARPRASRPRSHRAVALDRVQPSPCASSSAASPSIIRVPVQRRCRPRPKRRSLTKLGELRRHRRPSSRATRRAGARRRRAPLC